MLRCLAPFRAQLVGNQGSWGDEVPHTLLGAKNPASQGRNTELVVFYAEMHSVANADPECLPYRGWDHQPPFFADLRPGLKFDMGLHLSHLLH
jgi:hypothetical protein